MGIRYRVDQALGVAFVDADGELGDADLLAFAEQASADAAYYSGVNELVDFSGASLGDIKSETIRRVAELFSAAGELSHSSSKVAIVVADDLGYGLTRMYQVFRGGSGDHPTVFRSVDEARVWLGLPEGSGP